ncbi:hypothetical protein BSL78_06561 [Apostichopus japonicus]|uniref:Ig-like domain-containing protein n=1 Tax=Stichopus japonicus TaxID=307972 RepID=A0A2G8L8H7_STIJA|nr:hypothetical protein BSL78_06561 [Apostichopus japonicus]
MFILTEPLSWTCDNTQYVQFGHGDTVSCTFPVDFRGVYWYDSPANSANLIVRMERQENGEYTKSGVGYTNGSYDIFQNGTLMIANVSSAHDRVFLVTLVDSGRIFKNFEINVVTIFNAGQLHPSVSACPNTSLCLVNSLEADILSCSYSNVRPAVTLSWEFSPRQQEMEVDGFSTSSRGFTYSSYSVLNITNHLQKPLTAVSCSASGPALGFKSTESTVVIDISNPTEMDWQEMEVMEKIAAVHTRLEIKCVHDMETMALLWKVGDITSSEILMFLSDGQMRHNQRVKSFIKFSVDGTMTFPDVTIHAEGTYTCVYTDGETYHSKTIKVIAAVLPVPPAVVADGCVWNSSKCAFFVSEMAFNVITCRVTGVYPAVNLKVVAANSAGISVETKKNSTERREDLFDVIVEAKLINQHSECSQDIVCLASGPSSTFFHATRTITFISESCDRGITTPTLFLLIGGFVLLLLLVAALLTILVKYRRTNSQKNSPPSVLEEFADTLLYWPLHKLSSTDVFDQEAIEILRTVSRENDENKRKENQKVAAGSAAGLFGGAMALGATVCPPVGGPALLVAGAAVGAVGAGVNIAAARDKSKKDRRQVERVKVPLKTFIEIQTQLAEVIVFLDLTYHFIPSIKVTSCLAANQVEEIERYIQDLKGKHNLEIGTLQEALTHIHAGTVDLLDFISNAASSETDTILSEWEEKRNNAKENPLETLPQSIKNLVVGDKCKGKMTFLSLIKLLYFPGEGISHCNPTGDAKNPGNANLPMELTKGGLLFGRTAVNVANVGEDLVAVGNSVFRIARGVSVAGVLLGSLGIVVDVAFLTKALIGLHGDKKGQFSQDISDVADEMQIMNKILRELTEIN